MKTSIRTVLKMLLTAVPLIGSTVTAGAQQVQPADQHDQIWVETLNADTAVAYARFILLFPESPMLEEARARLATLAAAEGLDVVRVPASMLQIDDDNEPAGRVDQGSSPIMNV